MQCNPLCNVDVAATAAAIAQLRVLVVSAAFTSAVFINAAAAAAACGLCCVCAAVGPHAAPASVSVSVSAFASFSASASASAFDCASFAVDDVLLGAYACSACLPLLNLLPSQPFV